MSRFSTFSLLPLLVLALAFVLAACSTPTAIKPIADSKPLAELDPAQVKDAVPRAEPILAAGNSSPYTIAGIEYSVLSSAAGYREQGIASWYGSKFHGRKTANGEVFDAYAASAAHRSLPLPTYVRVTNLDNQRSLIVRVNDRGPFHGDRLIDLSYGAAVKLGFATQGTASVEVVGLSVEGSEDLRSERELAGWQQDYRFLQLGSFSQRQSAENLLERLKSEVGVDAAVTVTEIRLQGRSFYRVRLGPVQDRQALLALQERMIAGGFGGAKLVAE